MYTQYRNIIPKAKELECHIFIEDNPSNAMQLANEGMKVLLIDTNYNKEIEHENIVRVNNWIDIHGFIQEYNQYYYWEKWEAIE